MFKSCLTIYSFTFAVCIPNLHRVEVNPLWCHKGHICQVATYLNSCFTPLTPIFRLLPNVVGWQGVTLSVSKPQSFFAGGCKQRATCAVFCRGFIGRLLMSLALEVKPWNWERSGTFWGGGRRHGNKWINRKNTRWRCRPVTLEAPFGCYCISPC